MDNKYSLADYAVEVRLNKMKDHFLFIIDKMVDWRRVNKLITHQLESVV